MKTLGILAALAVVAGANAQEIEHEAVATSFFSTSLDNLTAGHGGIQTNSGPTYAYDNTTTPTGSYYANGGTAAVSGVLTTKYVADDIAYTPNFNGQNVLTWGWSTVNAGTNAVSVRMRIRFHQDNGGVPGAYITGFSFAATTLAANTANLWYFNPTAGSVVLPTTGKVWMGITFDASGSTTNPTAADMDKLGQLTYNPPTAGSSQDLFFSSSAANIGNVNNPTGGNFNFGGAPVANFYNRLEAVPEPTSMAVLGLGVAALLRRRKKA